MDARAWATWALVAFFATLAVVAVVVAVTRKRGESPVAPAPINVIARPPMRKLTQGEKDLARVINAIDADMRSIELGRWFLRRLRDRAQDAEDGASCAQIASDVEYRDIAADVPGINAVTERETVANLRRLMRSLAATCKSGERDELVARIDELRESALGSTGILRGMPGYSEWSRVDLPYPDDD